MDPWVVVLIVLIAGLLAVAAMLLVLIPRLDQIHVLVNSRLIEALDRIDSLERALLRERGDHDPAAPASPVK